MASATASTGSVSPAGEALTMFPPSVPRFWIWTAPISRAAATRIGRRRAHERRGDDLADTWRARQSTARRGARMRRSSSRFQRFKNRRGPERAEVQRHEDVGAAGQRHNRLPVAQQTQARRARERGSRSSRARQELACANQSASRPPPVSFQSHPRNGPRLCAPVRLPGRCRRNPYTGRCCRRGRRARLRASRSSAVRPPP